MTRDEAHNKVIEWIDDLADKPTAWHYGKIELHRDIDRIFDSLESRKCDKCLYFSSSGYGFGLCSKGVSSDFKIGTFYCNRWAEK